MHRAPCSQKLGRGVSGEASNVPSNAPTSTKWISVPTVLLLSANGQRCSICKHVFTHAYQPTCTTIGTTPPFLRARLRTCPSFSKPSRHSHARLVHAHSSHVRAFVSTCRAPLTTCVHVCKRHQDQWNPYRPRRIFSTDDGASRIRRHGIAQMELRRRREGAQMDPVELRSGAEGGRKRQMAQKRAIR